MLVNGTITFGGSMTNGVIYDVNQQNVQPPNTDVVTLGGTSTVVGGIDVNGLGTVSLGKQRQRAQLRQPQRQQAVWRPRVCLIRVPVPYGVRRRPSAPNSFRQLPAGQ